MVATRQMSVEEFEATSFEGRWELIDGEVIEMSPSSDVSSSIGLTIGAILWAHVRPNRLGRLYGADAGFVIFPERPTVRVPDVAFVRADRAPQGEARKHFPRLAPDLVVEVLSPTDRISDVVAKIEKYQKAVLPLIWLVDPEKMIVTVIAAGKATAVLTANDALDGGDIIPGFSVAVSEFFD